MAPDIIRFTSPALLCFALSIGCGGLNPTNDASVVPIDAKMETIDSPGVPGTDAPGPSVCDPAAPFGPWVALSSELQGAEYIDPEYASEDELTFYYSAHFKNPFSNIVEYHLYVSRRASKNDKFGAPVGLGIRAGSIAWERSPMVTADGLSLFFDASANATSGAGIYISTRTGTLASFGAPELASGVNTTGVSRQPFLTADKSELLFSSNRSGQWEILRAAVTASGFANPTPVSAINSDNSDWYPRLSTDGLTVYLSSDRAGGAGSFDVWRARRTTVNDGFPTPTPVTELNTIDDDFV